MKINTQYLILNINKGAATLPIILLVGGLVVEIGIAGIFIAYFLSQSGFGVKLSNEAFAASQAGIQDAIMKIVRNKNLDYTTSGSPYTLNIGNRSAQVTICKDFKTVSTSCDTANTGKDEITSLGSALTKRRKLQVIVNINSITGEVDIESEREIEL